MDDNVLFKLLDHAWVVIMGLVAFVIKGIHSDVESLKGGRDHCEVELQKFKTHVSENYSREVSTQASLARVHERIDKLGDIVEDKTNEISKDIKILLQRGK